MKKRFYIGLIVFAVLALALGRLIVRPPGLPRVRRRWRHPRFGSGLSTRLRVPQRPAGAQALDVRVCSRTAPQPTNSGLRLAEEATHAL
jgi:hypothetical protein